jgi:metal-responsive CopG/Arc/MetJ family transcriptional regulator
LVEKLEINLPAELVEGIDKVCELLGFSSREEVVVVAVRRLVDGYKVLAVRTGD